jgi:hypothetical protein
LGQSLLMQDMCRVLGIPAVFGDGFRGHMKTFSVDAMHKQFEGHAWLFVYLDGEWILYDPVWHVDGTTDRKFIEENYYIDSVGGITPIYDENYMPPFRTPETAFAYMNGMFIGLEYGQPSTMGSGFWVNYCMSIGAVAHSENDGFFYMDGPAAFIYAGGMEECELYSNGWIAYGDSGFLFGDAVSFVYENGIQASETVMRRGNETFYFDNGIGNKICLPDEVYRLIDGKLTVDVNHKGKVWQPHDHLLPEGEYQYKWSTSDESIATVDENGVVTCHKAGKVDIICIVTGVGYRGNEEYVATEESNPKNIVADIVDGVIVGQKEVLGHIMTVHFGEDISRPAKYAALDPGGPAYVETETARVGTRDIYPIMTDDMLMMFDPVDGVVTLPTAQNANGYFILPDTYESALKYPYDFKLPLSEGYLMLDRETLKTFTQVNTDKWGEMWYLPLTEEGKGAWGPGSAIGPEQPNDIDFGYPAIPTENILVDYLFDDIIAGIVPENDVIILPPMPEYNGANLFLSTLKIVGYQNCGLEFSFSTGTMMLDAASVQALLSGPDAEMAELWLIRMENEWCDYGQQGRLERMAVDGIYHLHAELWADNGNINHLNGGTVTVTVPLNSAGGNFEAFFVDAHGNYTKVSSTVNGGTITFQTPYFATYAIIDTAKTPVN